uniref:Cuticular protein hypothetical 28 [Bombyx mori] n=1 Tax=Lepeophtheirus salmonis TaxID=72036 RepID=A0A0K2U4D9_LEPSM
MRFSILGLTILCFGLTLAQDEKRLRLRRPRPFKDIDNVDGIARGRPVPLKSGRSDPSHLLASAFQGQESQQRSQQAHSALESLLATAGRDVPSEEVPFNEVPSSQRGQIQQQQRAQFQQQQQQRVQIPQQQRAQISHQQQRGRPVEVSEEAQRPTKPRGRTRLAPKIPRRNPSIDNEAETAQKFKPRKPFVKTTERYSNENDDGSFTFGYVSEDGSFREETRGVDCITRGKYGYIDPEGKKREFTYVSGLPCDTPEEGIADEDENSLQRVIQDPVDPAERFRTSNPVQLSGNDLPPAFVRTRQRVRRPQSETPTLTSSQQRRPQPPPSSPQESFPSFSRDRVRPPTSAPTRRPAISSGALNNLFAIVDDKPTAPTTPSRPVTPITRRPQSPTPSRAPPSPTPSQRPTAIPSPTPSRIPSPTPTPSRRPNPTPSRRPNPTPSRSPSPIPSRSPSPGPGTFDFQSTLADFENNRPALTFAQQQRNRNKPEAAGPNFSSELSFNPESGTFQTELRQNFGGQEQLRLSQANAPSGHSNQNSGSFASTTATSPFASFTTTTAAPPRSRPRPTSSSFGSNASPSLEFQPLEFPDPASIRLPTPTAAAPEKSVFFKPFPSSTAAPPPVPSTTRRPPTSFPVTPTATPVRTLPPSQNRPPPPQNRPPPPPFQSRPPPPPRQSRPPVPPPPQPFSTASNPSIQFGFNPIASQSQQNRPFTAFANGTPPQLSGSVQPSFQFQPQSTGQFQPQSSGQFQPQSSGRFRSFPQQASFAPQSEGGSRFPSAGRPPPPPQQNSAASAPFAVFNPAAFAGNRRA